MIEKATFAGGCFWCTEAIFKRLRGVLSVVPGYTGGNMDTPSYDDVCRGSTGHAEAIQIEFDSEQISFDKLLDIFWNTHNPTTMNRQGNDTGTQYRSAIFYHDDKQKKIAEQSKMEFEKSGAYSDPVVTLIVPFVEFFEAEEYHKNYYDKNPSAGYCSVVIGPKIHKLLEKYGNDVKEEFK